MIHRPDLAANPEDAVIHVDGRPMRHVGEGRFVPAQLAPANDETLAKRFEPGGPLLKAG